MPSRTDRRDATSLAAAVSGLQIDFITGVDGDSVPEAALPPSGSTQSVKLSKGIRGSCRCFSSGKCLMSRERLFVNSSFLLKHSLISMLIRRTGRSHMNALQS
jgi:hypothetical protein